MLSKPSGTSGAAPNTRSVRDWQPHTPTCLIVWSDGGRERLSWHEDHAEAVRQAERLRTRLEAKGWTFEAALDTGHGWVVVDTTGGVDDGQEDAEEVYG